jgi:prevent-host-death family protein
MKLKEAVRPITYLKNRAADVVHDVAEGGSPYVITQNGEARAVVLGVGQYDAWRKALALMKIIAIGEAEIARGETATLEEVSAAAKRAIDD